MNDISNAHMEFVQTASKDFPVQREFYGVTYLTGLRVQLN